MRLKNNKYKPVEIRDALHHKLKLIALNEDVLLRELASVIIEHTLSEDELLKQLVAKLTGKLPSQITR